MNRLKLLFFIPLICALISCEPIRITTTIKPFKFEPPQETTIVKKLPYEAWILIDDSKTSTYTWTDYAFGTTHTVNFPSGNILRQVLPVYFDSMFSKTRYEKSLSVVLSKNEIAIHADNEINFSEKRGANELMVIAETIFKIYDSNLIEVSVPIYGNGIGEFTKRGLLGLEEKDYGNTAYQATYKSVKKEIDEIYDAITNPKAQIAKAKEEIKKNPSNTLPYRVVSNLSLKNNDIAEAIAAAQMHVQLEPKDPLGYFLLYKSYLAQKKYKDALVQLEHTVSLNPKSALFSTRLWEFYAERDRYEKAIEVKKRYIEQRPDDKFAPLWLARLYFKVGRYEEVLAISEKAIKEFFYRSGLGLNIEKNENEYARIKSIVSNSPAHKASLEPNYEIIEIEGKSTLKMKLNEVVEKLRGQEGTQIKLKLKKLDSDETIAKTLVREKFYTDHEVASYMGIIALSYLEINDKSKAKTYIEEAQKISSQNSNVILAKAYLYLKDMEYEKALNEVSLVKDNDYALLLQAIAYGKMGKYEESLNLSKKILKSKDLMITKKVKNNLFSTLYPYLENLEKTAIEYEKKGQHGQALKEYSRLLEISDPDKAQLIRSRVARIISQNPSLVELKGDERKYFLNAEVLFTNNKFEEAIEELEKASKIQPFNPQIYFNKSIVYEKISEYAKAIENMETYIQLNPQAPNAQTIKDQIHKWRFILEREI